MKQEPTFEHIAASFESEVTKVAAPHRILRAGDRQDGLVAAFFGELTHAQREQVREVAHTFKCRYGKPNVVFNFHEVK